MSGFFSRVSRYAKPARAEQRENRLTGIFAAVLEHADGVALDLAWAWLTVKPDDVPGADATSWASTRAAFDESGLVLRHPVST